MKKDLTPLEKIIHVRFKNESILQQALVHRSYLNEHPRFSLDHNERLEFLGDAVLELVVTEHLYNTYPNPEGELTNWRAALVNANKLAEIAKRINLEKFLYLSKGESRDNQGKARLYILANAMESLIGAVYLDQGWDATKTFIHDFVIVDLPYILENKLYMDPKSRFQEAAQEKIGVTPTYSVLSESGPDHNKWFIMGIFLGEELVAKGEGASKQEAQMSAAENGLKAKNW